MAEKFAFVGVVHETNDGTEVITRVRAEYAEAYAALVQAEPFVKRGSVRVLTINPASKTRLAELGVS
jgi:hypothetical protein